MGFYGGAFEGNSWSPVNVAGCYMNSEKEMIRCVAKCISHVKGGKHGTADDLKGWEAWTAS
jgi:hypothetical protein